RRPSRCVVLHTAGARAGDAARRHPCTPHVLRRVGARVSDIVYLYGFVPADTDTADMPDGIDGRPGEPVPAGGAVALITKLPSDTYAAGALESRLEDLDWVAARGLAHERVVAWGVDHADIVPAPLFTLFSSLDALRADAG